MIATLAARAADRSQIVSGDRDLFALVRDPDVDVLYPADAASRSSLVVDEAEITRRYGIPGRALSATSRCCAATRRTACRA